MLDLIVRRHKQLILHSFLYYKLGESIIEDHVFDAWCKELVELHNKYPELAQQSPYWEIAKEFDSSGSGYFIQDYPNEIMSTAFHVLAMHKKVPVNELSIRYGYTMIPYSEWLEQQNKPKKKKRGKKK